MANHDEYKERLSALLDGELRETERTETLAHLDECEACRAYFAELTALHEALSDPEPVDVPEGFAAGVLARLHEAKPEKRRAHRRSWAALAACAAVVVLAVTVMPNLFRMGKSAPPQSAAPMAPDMESQTFMSVTADGAEEDAEEESAPLEAELWATSGAAPAALPEEPEGAADGSAARDNAVTMFTEAATASDAGAYEALDETLLLSGEGAARWLRENGSWDEDMRAYWVGLDALEDLPEGLRVEDAEALARWSEDGYTAALVREAETEDEE